MTLRKLANLTSTLAMMICIPAMAEDNTIELMTSWTSGSEAAALAVYRDQFEKSGGRWIDSSIAGFGAADAAFLNRVIAGKPPTAKQIPIGEAAREFVEQGILADLTTLAQQQNWKSAMPASIYELISYDGKVYLAPTGAHGESWMFYSIQAFKKAGVKTPLNSWEELFSALDKLKAAGLIPLAWGGQSWQEATVFNMILLSQVGQQGYLAIYKQKEQTSILREGVKKALAIYRRLSEYDDEGSPGRNWNDATSMLISGKAGIQFIGDFAKGEFTQADLQLGKDYGCALIPESQAMVYIADSISFTNMNNKGATSAQKKLASIIMDPKQQVEFSLKKGSIPIRNDVDVSQLDECSKQGLKLFNDNKIVPDFSLLITPEQKGNLVDLVDNFWVNPDISIDDTMEKFFSVIKH